MHAFFRTVLPVTATILALTYQTACSSDGDDQATGGKSSGGSSGSAGSATGGSSGTASGGDSGRGGTSSGGTATGGSSTGGAGGAAGGTPGGAGGSSGGEECFGMICPEGTFCSECYNFDNPDEPLHACIDDGTSC